MGVMRCITEMEWGECLEVNQKGCKPGEAWYGHLQRCGCYQHIPCRVGGFEMCGTQGDRLNRTCVFMEQSVFSTVKDRVHSESSASSSASVDRTNLVTIFTFLVILVPSSLGAALLLVGLVYTLYRGLLGIVDCYRACTRILS